MATHKENCLVCHGTGRHPNVPGKVCPRCKDRRPCKPCGATGIDPVMGGECASCKGKGVRRARRKCKQCHGTGKDVLGNTCTFCAGTGKAKKRASTDMLVAGEVTSNSIEVGEFASELVAATCYRERTGLVEGDWMDDPTRAMTDGACFAEEVRRAAQNTFQVTVSLDTSGSMYHARAGVANPLFYAMHKAMQDSIRILSPGMLRYQPFIFGDSSFPCPEAYMRYYKQVTLKMVKGGYVHVTFPPSRADFADIEKAKAEGLFIENRYGHSYIPSRIFGGGTYFGQLVTAIQTWENKQEPVSGQLTKLDIVITDGGIDEVEEANRTQGERAAGCKLRTVMLNVTGRRLASEKGRLPDFTEEFPVELEMVTAQVRNVLMDSIQELLA